MVWDILADLSLTPLVNRETRVTEWIPPAEDWRVGARFSATNRIGDSEWTIDCHVTASDRPSELGWTVLDPAHPSTTWWYRLAPTTDGTSVSHGFVHGPGPSGLRFAVDRSPEAAEQMIASRLSMLAANMAHTLERVSAIAAGQEPQLT